MVQKEGELIEQAQIKESTLKKEIPSLFLEE